MSYLIINDGFTKSSLWLLVSIPLREDILSNEAQIWLTKESKRVSIPLREDILSNTFEFKYLEESILGRFNSPKGRYLI